ANVGCAVVLVVEALEVAEAVGHLRRTMFGIAHAVQFVPPECSAISEDVEFVEQLAAIPKWLGFVLDEGLLPCIDLSAPILIVLQCCAGNLPCIGSRRSEEFCVVAQPLASAAEFGDGKIPGKGHGDDLFLVWSQGEAHGDCCRHWLSGARELRGPIREASICREGLPYFFTRSIGHPVRNVGDFDTGSGERSDSKLSIPFFLYRSAAQTIEDDPLHIPILNLLGAVRIRVLIIEDAAEAACGIAKPAHHVRPRKKN